MCKSLLLLALLALSCPALAQIGTPTTVYVATSDATIANTATETSLLSSGVGATTVAANSLYAGRTYRFVIYGYMSTTSILPTLTARVKVGSVTMASCVFSGLVLSLNQQAFSAAFTFTCRSVGASGTIMGMGNVSYSTSTLALTPSNGVKREDLKMTSPATVDTTIANTFDFTMQWGTAATANTLTRTCIVLEELN